MYTPTHRYFTKYRLCNFDASFSFLKNQISTGPSLEGGQRGRSPPYFFRIYYIGALNLENFKKSYYQPPPKFQNANEGTDINKCIIEFGLSCKAFCIMIFIRTSHIYCHPSFIVPICQYITFTYNSNVLEKGLEVSIITTCDVCRLNYLECFFSANFKRCLGKHYRYTMQG